MIAPLLDLLYGERCERCAALRTRRGWSTTGAPVRGLRSWDSPHLCASCAAELAGQPVVAYLGGVAAAAPPVYAARREDAGLVDLVGALKYRGLRGMAWPLGRLMVPAATAALAQVGQVDAFVALPLHARRQRERGFNQAELLARVVGQALGLPVLEGGLRRRRATGQQASLAAGDAPHRHGNVAGAFAARPPDATAPRRIALVDDLVTTGATWCEAARALSAAGWDVRWGLALGAAARLATLDTVAASS